MNEVKFMTEKQIYNLQIDEYFKQLIPPLTSNEQKQLEQNILKDGCREPLCVWGNTIVDGHNRYDICTRLQIPFFVQYVDFASREESITWICATQLGRRNISEETKRYLIGKRYEMEKILGKMNPSGKNQYKFNNIAILSEDKAIIKKYTHKTAEKLGAEYHISPKTIRKYAAYAKSIDNIAKKEPELIAEVLNGQIKISQYNIKKLSKQPCKVVHNVKNQLDNTTNNFVTYSNARKIIPVKREKVTVKDMPAYDPDAEIASLALTIPAWAKSIERALSIANFDKTSTKARIRLQNELKKLEYTVNVMLLKMEEK
jgi:hypothetical protein